MSQRLPNWSARLMALLDDRKRTPFAWGSNDCALFAADALIEVTGTDFAEPWRGRYDSKRGAHLALRKAGFKCLSDAVTAALGEPLPPAWATRGDVLAYAGPRGGEALAVCVGLLAVAPGEKGLVYIPQNVWLRCWHDE